MSLPHRSAQNQNNKNSKDPQGSALCIDARVWCFRILVPLGSLGLRHENLTRISACALQLAFRMPLHFENQPPKPQFYTVPNDKDTLYPLVAANKPQPHGEQLKKDSQISNFCWHVSFGGGSQDEYRARSKPRSCKVMNDTPRQYRKRRSLTVTFFPLRNLFLRVLRPAGCHKVTISHRQDPNRTMSYPDISRS